MLQGRKRGFGAAASVATGGMHDCSAMRLELNVWKGEDTDVSFMRRLDCQHIQEACEDVKYVD